MKKSNLLLMGTFATFLLLLLGLHLMVAARFKSGQYKTLSDDAWMADFTWITLAPAKVIEVKDVQGIEVYSAAGAKWGVRKNNKDEFKSQMVGDTMRIWPAAKNGYKKLHLFVDSTIQLKVSECDVEFHAAKSNAPSTLNAVLNQSRFHMRTSENDSAHVDVLNINAGGNSIIHLHNSFVGKANIKLSDSRFIADQAMVQEMSLQADDASKVEISAKQLRSLQTKQ